MGRVLVTGAGGAIGGHLVKRLLDDGHEVAACDIKGDGEWWQMHDGADNYVRTQATDVLDLAFDTTGALDVVYHLAADMGGMGYIGDKGRDRSVLVGNMVTDLLTMRGAGWTGADTRFVFTSSACVYNQDMQAGDSDGMLSEKDAYPANPDTEYGWEKLFAERVLGALKSDSFRPLAVRLHNVYGNCGSWTGGREKAPAALCRKVAEAKLAGKREIEIWGDGEQRRSYLYVDDCVEGLVRLSAIDRTEPINLGSDRSVSVNELAYMIEEIAEWKCVHRHIAGPQGVRARNADITQLRKTLGGWEPQVSLEDGLARLYSWVEQQVKEAAK